MKKEKKRAGLKTQLEKRADIKKPPGRKRDNKQKETLPNKIGCARIKGMM